MTVPLILVGCASYRLSTTSSGKLSLGALRRDTQVELSLSSDDLLTSCSVLCTADYCLDTTQQLEAKLREKIDAPLSDKIDFTSEQEGFHR